MPSSLVTLLIVAFASLVLGVVAGLLFSSLRADREEEPQPGEETPPGGRPGRYTPVVRLWREKTTETLIVEVDGKSYLAPDPLAMSQRENLEKALGQLAGWLGVQVVGSEIPAARLAAVRPPVQPVPEAAPAQPQSQAPAVQAPRSEPIQLPPVMPPAYAAAARPVKIPPPGVQPPIKEEPKSIVGQIDAILQDMLVSAGLDNRGIGLTEDPRRGVIVSIGLQRFEGIDAVTDVEVKKILRAAVSEWERRQEPPPRF